jgi:AcrR family transcriptional regulator
MPRRPDPSADARAPARAQARPYHHGALRESLLATAEAWLDARGTETLTLRELAKAAGVSHAAPYHHFAGRDELLAGVAERAFVRLGDALAAAAAAAPDARAALLDIGEAYVRVALAHPARFRLMFGPTLAGKEAHAGLKTAADRAFGVLLAAARAHSPDGGVELALAGWSLAHGVANLAIDGALSGLPLPPEDARAIAQLEATTLVRRMAAGLLGDAAGAAGAAGAAPGAGAPAAPARSRRR